MTAQEAEAPRSSFFVGALFVLAAGLSWSFTGIFLRLAPHLDSWQFLVWRSFGIACASLVIARPSGSGSPLGRLVAIGLPGVVVSLAFGLASIAFIVAMKATTVANALFLSSCAPLFAAALGYFILGERLNLRQAASITLGFVGLGIIVGGAFEGGNLAGNITAMLTALGFAAASVAMRFWGARDYTPALLGYGIFVCLVAVLVCAAKGVTLLPPALELLAAFAGGFLAMGIGFAFFLRGAPRVPAASQTVLAQTETIFGPIWVWLAFGETPALSTLIGGVVILAAVISMATAGGGSRRGSEFVERPS